MLVCSATAPTEGGLSMSELKQSEFRWKAWQSTDRGSICLVHVTGETPAIRHDKGEVSYKVSGNSRRGGLYVQRDGEWELIDMLPGTQVTIPRGQAYRFRTRRGIWLAMKATCPNTIAYKQDWVLVDEDIS